MPCHDGRSTRAGGGARRVLALWLGMVLVVGTTASARSEEAVPSEGSGEERVPAEAEPFLEKGGELYEAGKCREAMEAFRQAEAAGARSGQLFYRMGYCVGVLGDAAAALRSRRRAIPYLEHRIETEAGGVDPYYYLAALYFNDLDDREQGARIAHRGIEAHTSGALGDLDGEQFFRLGRLYGFALEASAAEDRAALERRRTQAYRAAADGLRRQRSPNRTYRILAAMAVGDAAQAEGDTVTAIEYYGRASLTDPMSPAAAEALQVIALAASRRGDLEEAAAAWLAIRGPDALKTPAQYGLRLARRALAYGELPDTLQDEPIAGLDAAGLERGILEAAQVLRAAAAAAAAGEEAGPDPEEVKRQRGIFLALCLALLNQGHDLRTFVLANQLAPLIFR